MIRRGSRLLQRFRALSSKKVALLIFFIVFPILFVCRIPRFVEADTLFYADRMLRFVKGWDVFIPKAVTMVKHLLYLVVLGVFRVLTPFLSVEGTITLFSTFFSALTIALTYMLSEKIFKDRNIALISATMFFCTRMFLYYGLLGEQYTFQAFFTLVTLILIYEDRYTLASIVLGISLIASPSCGYFILGFMYLIWKRSKSWKVLAGIWVIPTIIFAPFLFTFGYSYFKNIGWTLTSAVYHVVQGEVILGALIVGSKLIDNFIVFLPFLMYGLYIALKKNNETYREVLYLFLLSVVPATPLIIVGGVAKWYLPMMPFFILCATIPFKESLKLKKIFPLLAAINLIFIFSHVIIPLHTESISQYDIFVSGELPNPIIMRWSSGLFYEYYCPGTGRFYEIMSVEHADTWRYSLDGIFEEHGKVYLYDYIEVQCLPTTSMYGIARSFIYGDELFTVIERMKSQFDFNYTIFREYDDGTIVWELTPK